VLNRRLVDAYEHGDLGYVDVLLRRARSPTSFATLERYPVLGEGDESTIRARRR